MSRWTHAICEPCFDDRMLRAGTPDRTPVRIKDAEGEGCCWCSKVTSAGIFVRDDPNAVPCAGNHKADL